MKQRLNANEDRLRATIDIPFLLILLVLLGVGLAMLYSASSAQSAYDTGYTSTTRYLVKQGFCALMGWR